MRRLVVTILAFSLLVSGAAMATTAGAQSSGKTMEFGMDSKSIKAQTRAGAAPDYGAMWIGPWNLEKGWGEPRDELREMRKAGVTPVIHFYYWGDDISRKCVKDGCWSSLHGVQKTESGWKRLADGLVDLLEKEMNGRKVVIIMESEFNKDDMQTYKPFDRQLRDMMDRISDKYPRAEMVLGLGNWNRDAWSTWTRSAAAADQIGIQGMRGSTQDSRSEYRDLFEDTLKGARKAKSEFGKPVFITDIALSSYPNKDYRKHQERELQEFFDGMDKLKRAGVTAMLYRTWGDQEWKNLDNYYGKAERHWGLADKNGKWKPAASVWVEGVQDERYDVDFRIGNRASEWWTEVYVDAKKDPERVHVRVDGGSWTRLSESDWGSWTRVHNIEEGSKVEFRATSKEGHQAYSKTYRWLK
jgi:hypothetical protein